MLNSFFYLVKQGFKNLWNNRLMSLASVGVLVSLHASYRSGGASFRQRFKHC